MVIDLRTIIILLGISHLMQILVFYYQYRINKIVKGPGWWLLWSAAESVGFTLILLRPISSLLPIVIVFQDPLLVLGMIFIYIGAIRFFDKKENAKIVGSIFASFVLSHLFFYFVHDDINIRSLLITIYLIIISFLIIVGFYKNKTASIASTINFNSGILVLHITFLVYRFIAIIIDKPGPNMLAATTLNSLLYFDVLIVSLAWTFGFIIMLNQRLNSEITEAKEHFEQIFNTSPDAVAITRLEDGVYADCNDSFLRISGYTKQELIGRSSVEVNIWDAPVDRSAMAGLVKAKGYCENFEAQFVRKSGEVFTGLMSAKIMSLHGYPHIISITRDISERKKAENALRESEQQLQFVLHGSQLGFWDWSLETNVIKRNERWAEMLGYTVDEVDFTFQQWIDLVHPDDREIALQAGKEHINGRTPMYKIEYRMLAKDGTYKWILDQAKVVAWDADGKALRMSGTHTDITEQRRVEQEILLKNQQLIEVNSEKDKFFSIISHDLKSPFMGFLGLTQIFAEETDNYSATELAKLGNELHQSASNLFKLLKNLLEWAQMQKDSISFQPENLVLSDLIDENTEVLKHISEQKSITLINNVAPSMQIYADKKMMNSVLLNLLSNGVKFTRRGGSITVSAIEAENHMFEIRVEDSGIGMKKDDAERLFKPGEKVKAKGTEGEFGTGLGLILCKEFIEKHNGKIWVESEEGKGSTFRFTLPTDKSKFSL